MTARANLEAQLHGQLARYKQDVADGVYRVHADNTLIDAILKYADKYAEKGVQAALTQHQAAEHARREAAARPLIHAVRQVKVTHG